MIRLVWRTDVHCSDHTPSSRTDDWMTEVLDSLQQVGDIALRVGANAILDGGDFFDPKVPMRISHKLMQRVISLHSTYPCPVYANVGNHDCRQSQLSALPEGPLGSLMESGVFKRCYTVRDKGQVVDRHSVVFDDYARKVKVEGIPYHGPKYDMSYFKDIQKGDADYLVVMAHVLASPQGGSMFAGEDIVRYSDLLELNPEVDLWMFGHWHQDQGVTEIAPNKWVVNIGSLTRGSLTQDNITRIPGVAVISFGDIGSGGRIGIQVERLNVRPAEEVFDLQKRVREEAKAMTIDAFVNEVQDSLTKREKGELTESIQGMNIPNAVKERTLELLERASKR